MHAKLQRKRSDSTLCRRQQSLAFCFEFCIRNIKLMTSSIDIKTIVFASGCFWCTEAIFSRIKGVISVIPGYSGGQTENPNYELVHSGTTGHAECVQIKYDSSVISFEDLLIVYFFTHDPTTLNRQGNDVGTQYRSAIFYTEESQKIESFAFIDQLTKGGAYDDPIVTEVLPLKLFYKAEAEHLEY
jgi:peptide-methionine (S)-S-oxide reductase